MKSEYDIQADKFLSANGIKFSFVDRGDTCPPYCDGKCVHGASARGHAQQAPLLREHVL